MGWSRTTIAVDLTSEFSPNIAGLGQAKNRHSTMRLIEHRKKKAEMRVTARARGTINVKNPERAAEARQGQLTHGDETKTGRLPVPSRSEHSSTGQEIKRNNQLKTER